MKMIIKINLIVLLLTMMTTMASTTEKTDSAFVAKGSTRAEIQIPREYYSQPKDIAFILNTLIKKEEKIRLPQEIDSSFKALDPVIAYSDKAYQPWLKNLQKKVMFVLGSLNLKQIRLTSWALNLYNEKGTKIKQITGVGHPPEAFYWNGLNNDYHPVDIGQDYIPEIVLKDMQNRIVRLPQPKITLDQFVWEEKRYIKAGFSQDQLFESSRLIIKGEGQQLMQELSYLIDQHKIILLTIEGSGPDLELTKKRLAKLHHHFSKQHLHIKKVQISKVDYASKEVIFIFALKI